MVDRNKMKSRNARDSADSLVTKFYHSTQGSINSEKKTRTTLAKKV